MFNGFSNNEINNSLNNNNNKNKEISNPTFNKLKNIYSNYLLSHSNTKLIIDNSTLENISVDDYIQNNNNFFIPIPYKSKKILMNPKKKKEIIQLERNAVTLRRFYYSNNLLKNKIQKKYGKNLFEIIFIQKHIKSFLIRKLMNNIKNYKNNIIKFIDVIKIYCLMKRKGSLYKNEVLWNNENKYLNNERKLKNYKKNSKFNEILFNKKINNNNNDNFNIVDDESIYFNNKNLDDTSYYSNRSKISHLDNKKNKKIKVLIIKIIIQKIIKTLMQIIIKIII